MKHIYCLSLTTENILRVLQRISSVLARHRINVEQLNVFETKCKVVSHFNIVIEVEETLIDKLIKQLQRIIEVYEVHVSNMIAINNKNKFFMKM